MYKNFVSRWDIKVYTDGVKWTFIYRDNKGRVHSVDGENPGGWLLTAIRSMYDVAGDTCPLVVEPDLLAIDGIDPRTVEM